MANSREIKKRITSVQNTKKITGTMEMIATARAKQVQNRIRASRPYTDKLAAVAAQIQAGSASSSGGGQAQHPLLLPPKEVNRMVLIVLTANRGLCGGFNHNIITKAENVLAKHREDGREVELVFSGSKGIRWFSDEKPWKTYEEFDYKPPYDLVEELANTLMDRYIKGEIGLVEILYTKFISAGEQRPVAQQLLPIPEPDVPAEKEQETSRGQVDFIFEPDPQSILETILPLSVRMALFTILLESAASEQVARRIAMKNATDAADDMSKELRRTYNRARQTQITLELADIVGASAAID